jgi:glycine/D-amino acid oxidase-like deaminating enzyme
MISFWEQSSFLQYDFIIVGSGIVGLSTAASILENKPNAKVLILEKGLLPSGASTKNAGFACYGSLTEILADIKTMPKEKVLQLVALRYKGLNKLRQRLGDANIGFEHYGGYELLFTENDERLNEIDSLNQLLQPVFQSNAIAVKNESINTFGFSEKVKHLIYHPHEGQIDTGKMMSNLIDYVTRLGAKIITGATVEGYEDNVEGTSIYTSENAAHSSLNFKSKKLIFCTNAFTKKFFPQLEIKPGRGQVLITKPIHNIKFKGVFHFDEGYYYFRNVGNRVLFGGGRNIDFEAENTTSFGTTEKIMNDLTQKLQEIILPETPFEIDQSWSGIMAFGEDKFPILERINQHIIVAARLGGMGIAIGSELGEQAAAMVLEK